MVEGCDSALTNRPNPGDEPLTSRHPVLVGMYDEFTDAIRDGQIKCWGKRLEPLVVRDGHWVRWADAPEEGLLLVDNRGLAVEAGDAS